MQTVIIKFALQDQSQLSATLAHVSW